MADRQAPRVSIIVPTLNEEEVIQSALRSLLPLRERGCEVIVADGGSTDKTFELARGLADAVLEAPRGRAAQMNAGASRAKGDVLLFLHADTQLPARADELIRRGLAKNGRRWGRFDVLIDGENPLLRIIAWFMNHRSRLTGICTGDQGMFVCRETFWQIGGFADIELMEDIALAGKLKAVGPPHCLKTCVITSGRRWQRDGILYTMLKMWGLRLAFWLGVEPARLAAIYGYPPRHR